jgi:hypothetical protein
MSYYVTLPSNGADLKSEHGLLNNSQSDFEIELNVTFLTRNMKLQLQKSVSERLG